MKLAIISDIHNNLTNLDKVIKFCLAKNLDMIICCGDTGDQETWTKLCKIWTKPIYAVCGNLEDDDYIFDDFPRKKFPNLSLSNRTNEIGLGGKKIGFAHWPDIAKKLIANNDVVFYGHTHKPWEELIDGKLFLNPGNVSGQLYKASFAVYDTDNQQRTLVIIDQLP